MRIRISMFAAAVTVVVVVVMVVMAMWSCGFDSRKLKDTHRDGKMLPRALVVMTV